MPVCAATSRERSWKRRVVGNHHEPLASQQRDLNTGPPRQAVESGTLGSIHFDVPATQKGAHTKAPRRVSLTSHTRAGSGMKSMLCRGSARGKPSTLRQTVTQCRLYYDATLKVRNARNPFANRVIRQ